MTYARVLFKDVTPNEIILCDLTESDLPILFEGQLDPEASATADNYSIEERFI
jgi:hypothetical protein